jgi:hypothetical protein
VNSGFGELNMIRTALFMSKTAALAGAFGLLGLTSLPATAATIDLGGSGLMNWGAQLLGSASGNVETTPPTSDYGNNYALSVPGQYTFFDSFGHQSNVITGTSSPVGTYSFQDTYEFSVSQVASGGVLAVSLNLGSGTPIFDISNLQLRLYEVTSTSVKPGPGLPPGSTLITAWMGTSGPSTGQSIQTQFSGLTAGTYFLDVAGTADGSSGGAYVGQINFSPPVAPVPLPAALPMLLSGLGLLGGAGIWRRRTSAAA